MYLSLRAKVGRDAAVRVNCVANLLFFDENVRWQRVSDAAINCLNVKSCTK